MTTSRWTRRLRAAAPLLVSLLGPACRREAERSDPPARAEPPVAAPATRSDSASARSARPPALAAGSCTVENVTDGDTVRCADGRRVRLLLIDAPELDQRPFGQESRRALQAILPVGTTLRYETDVQREDRYRRTLAYLFLPDGRMVNEEIVRRGYAVVLVYPPNVRYVDRLRAAAALARRERRGLHASNGFACEPREHRRQAC